MFIYRLILEQVKRGYLMEELLKELVEKNRKFTADGNVANYIPELDKADKNALGIYVTTLDGQEFFAGDYNTKFTIQSISKIISLMLAILDNGEEYVFSKVGATGFVMVYNFVTKKIFLEEKETDRQEEKS